ITHSVMSEFQREGRAHDRARRDHRGSLRSRTNKVFFGLPDTPLPRANCERPNKAPKGLGRGIHEAQIGSGRSARGSLLEPRSAKLQNVLAVTDGSRRVRQTGNISRPIRVTSPVPPTPPSPE